MGFQEEFYKMVQADEAIFMTQGKIDSVSERGDGMEVTTQRIAAG